MGTVVQVGKSQHWAASMYGRERQLLIHILGSVEEGDVEGVLGAMDDFWAHHFHMKGTDSWSIRKDLLDRTVREKAPVKCLELGTYCGYSALRIARNMPPNGRLVSVEVDPLFSAISTKIIEYAGLRDKVKVLTGTLDMRLEQVKKWITVPGEAAEKARLDFVLCDHSKERFLPDLELLEKSGLATTGTIVIGDTTVYPGDDAQSTKELLSHFAGSGKFRVQQHVGTGDRTSGITVCEWHLVV